MRDDVEALLQENNLSALQELSYNELFNVDGELLGKRYIRDITSKYHQLALRFHPDRTNNDAIKTEIFKLINKAYSVLIYKDTTSDASSSYRVEFEGRYIPYDSAGFFEPPSVRLTKRACDALRAEWAASDAWQKAYAENHKPPSVAVAPGTTFHKKSKSSTTGKKTHSEHKSGKACSVS